MVNCKKKNQQTTTKAQKITQHAELTDGIYYPYQRASLFTYAHGRKFSGLILNSGFGGGLSVESQPQNAE